jgi:hypothetical protein
MSDIDMESAVAALSATLPEVGYDDGMVAAEGVEAVEDNPNVESFTGFDPTVLPEDMQAVYRSMQGDYTRKTQELAEVRKSFDAFSEQGIDPNDALEAASLWQRMDTDADFAAQVSHQIQTRLEELGYQNAPNQDTAFSEENNNSYEGLPTELMQELHDMRQFREEMVQQQHEQSLMAEIEVAENAIRTTNPQYNDDDLGAIYSLADSTDGDLMAAQQVYHDIQQRLLGGYLQSKSVPHGATSAPSLPSSIPPKAFSSLDDAHKAAMEVVRNMS